MTTKLTFCCFALLILCGCSEPFLPEPIESDITGAESWIRPGIKAQPIEARIPVHPFMAGQGVNSMHSDAYSSDAHPASGPLGKNTQINTRVGSTMPGGQCATLTFAANGDLLGICAGITGFRIHRLKPRSLELLAEYKLPSRPSSFAALVHRDKSKIMEDSSGAYLYLDQQDRIVIADSDKIVHRLVSHQKDDDGWEIYSETSWDLGKVVPDDCLRPTNWFPDGECDLITAVMPDTNGLLWWATLAGRIGTIHQQTGKIKSIQLNDEEIQNGFSVAADGVYIVSDHAMYGFYADQQGTPMVRWREEYDRGTSRRVGTINQGSGTTPTLLGDRYVTITDNADERMNLLVYRRVGDPASQTQGRLICSMPLFTAGHSVTDNSMVAINRSIIVENNAGYINAMDQQDWSNAGGGIVRVDVRDDETGCDIVWLSEEHSPSVVPKLSLGNGVAYFHTFEPQDNGINAWFLMGLDYRTGETLFKIHTGSGSNYDNNWSPITLAPDGTAYVGTLKGLVAIWDQAE